MNIRFLTSSAIILFIPLVTGCTLFSSQTPPKPDAPAAWQQQSADTTAQNSPPGQWWSTFKDQTLDQLIAKGIEKNTDQRLAVARIREARALNQGAVSNLMPNVNADASVGRSKLSKNTGSSAADTSNVFAAGFDASWELDLFGRLQQQQIAASSEEAATIADSQAVKLSLVAELTQQYTLYRLYQKQVALAQDNTNAQEGVLKITQALYKQGIEGNLEVTRAQTLLETTRAQIPLYQAQAQATEYQIDYLTGDKPGVNQALLGDSPLIPLISNDVFMDVPLKVIQKRPDIIAAQKRVLEATAIKQSTIAEMFPDISLSAALGLTSDTAGRLLRGSSGAWSAGGSLLAPLFDFGRIRSDINVSKAREEQAEIAFEQTVLAALRDIETAANGYTKAKERYVTLDKAADASHKAVDIARKQYKEGILSQLDVLQAEQAAYQSDASRAQAAADQTSGFIALCKALALTPDTQAQPVSQEVPKAMDKPITKSEVQAPAEVTPQPVASSVVKATEVKPIMPAAPKAEPKVEENKVPTISAPLSDDAAENELFDK